MTEKTQEQLDAEAAAAAKASAAAAAKQAEKDAKAAEKAKKSAEAKAAKEAKADEAKAKKEADKAAKEAKKAAEKAAKEAAKAEKAAVAKMPEQNGIRRPKPDTETGKVWGLADSISASLGQPTPIANLLAAGQAQGLNDSTIRTQYARWRAFHGITGRLALPVAVPVVPVAGTEPAAETEPVAS